MQQERARVRKSKRSKRAGKKALLLRSPCCLYQTANIISWCAGIQSIVIPGEGAARSRNQSLRPSSLRAARRRRQRSSAARADTRGTQPPTTQTGRARQHWTSALCAISTACANGSHDDAAPLDQPAAQAHRGAAAGCDDGGLQAAGLHALVMHGFVCMQKRAAATCTRSSAPPRPTPPTKHTHIQQQPPRAPAPAARARAPARARSAARRQRRAPPRPPPPRRAAGTISATQTARARC